MKYLWLLKFKTEELFGNKHLITEEKKSRLTGKWNAALVTSLRQKKSIAFIKVTHIVMETKLEVLLWWRVFQVQQKQRCTFSCFSYAKQRRSVVKLFLDNLVIRTTSPSAFHLSFNIEVRKSKYKNNLCKQIRLHFHDSILFSCWCIQISLPSVLLDLFYNFSWN